MNVKGGVGSEQIDPRNALNMVIAREASIFPKMDKFETAV